MIALYEQVAYSIETHYAQMMDEFCETMIAEEVSEEEFVYHLEGYSDELVTEYTKWLETNKEYVSWRRAEYLTWREANE